MTAILTVKEFVDKIIDEAKLPTSNGVKILPVHIDHVKTLLTRAVTEDRNAGTPNFDAIADKVLSKYSHGEVIIIRQFILTALKYAQASGARFTAPDEADYAEAVGHAVEAFMTTLKGKGLL